MKPEWQIAVEQGRALSLIDKLYEQYCENLPKPTMQDKNTSGGSSGEVCRECGATPILEVQSKGVLHTVR